MHICCSACSLYPLQTLLSRSIDVTGFWFNPNIHPFTEYSMRLASLRRLQQDWNLDIAYVDRYGVKEFIRAVVHHEDDRCPVCYSMRLEATAEAARKMGVDGFTTTLLVSPYQKFDTIVRIGEEVGKRHAVPFYAEDFRTGWNEGVRQSRQLGLYRQKYCGCIYSEMDRYLRKTAECRQ
mgnify:CR=1 FL=1